MPQNKSLSSRHLHSVPDRKQGQPARPPKFIGDSPRSHDAKFARVVGEFAAIVFQTIVYAIYRGGECIDGVWWVYLSHKMIAQTLERPAKDRTVQRTVDKLEKLGVIEVWGKVNTSRFDRTLWYRVDEARFNELVAGSPATAEYVKMTYSITPFDQISPCLRVSLTTPSTSNWRTRAYICNAHGARAGFFKRDILKTEDLETHTSLNSDTSSEKALGCVKTEEVDMSESNETALALYKAEQKANLNLIRDIEKTLKTYPGIHRNTLKATHWNVLARAMDGLREQGAEDPHAIVRAFFDWVKIEPGDGSKMPFWDGKGRTLRVHNLKPDTLFKEQPRLLGWLETVWGWMEEGGGTEAPRKLTLGERLQQEIDAQDQTIDAEYTILNNME